MVMVRNPRASIGLLFFLIILLQSCATTRITKLSETDDEKRKVVVKEEVEVVQEEREKIFPEEKPERALKEEIDFSKTYSYEENLMMLRFSNLAYEELETIEQALFELGFDSNTTAELVEDGTADAQAYMISNEKAIIITFRGTESLTDLQADLTVLKTETKWGKVHNGFNGQFQAIWPRLSELLLSRLSNQPIWVTGHSLGGALATLFMVHVPEKLIEQIRGIYTYGQPRVGDKHFARMLDKHFPNNYFRMTNETDKVPRIPKINYYHGGLEIYYDETGNPYCGRPELGFLEETLGRIDFVKKAITGDIGKHSIKYYEENLLSPQLIQFQEDRPYQDIRCQQLVDKEEA